MAFDGILVRALTEEIREALREARVSKIQQPEPEELFITFKNSKGLVKLLISANASLPLLYITEENKPAPLTAPGFCMLLRKHIGSGRVLEVRDLLLERCIDIVFEHLDEMGDVRQKHLIVELMGKYSNIIFTDESFVILDSIRRVPPTVSSVRTVLPGRQYFLPETQGKEDALGKSFGELLGALKEGDTLQEAIFSHYTGFSVPSVSEFLFENGLDGSRRIEELSEEEKSAFIRSFSAWLDRIRSYDFAPESASEISGEPRSFSALPLPSYRSQPDKYEVTAWSSVSAMLIAYYREKNLVTNMKQRSQAMRQVVKTHLERSVKKLDLQKKQLRDTENREECRLFGELLTAFCYSLPVGEETVTVQNYYDGNREVKIHVDPDLSIADNARRYYEKYNKQKRTYIALSQLITETADEIGYLSSVLTAIDQALDIDSLKEIREELSESGYVSAEKTKNGRKEKIRSVPWHYLSSDGFHIYVGKSNTQNDYLTHKFADGSDMWFHVKNAPGSHVIVKTGGNALPDRTYEEAAALAVYYSSQRGAGRAEVDYVEKKQVKKPAGGKPGFVIYHTNYSLLSGSDISHLQILT